MSEQFLSARALTKTYAMGKRTLEVLRGVNLEVARGEFLALRGASGAGKSTLLHLIGGLDSPNAGEISFNGQNLAKFSEEKLTQFRNRRVGFVFQAYHLLPELTALENVCLPARVARISAAQTGKRGNELLARVGLKDRADHKPSELSGGEQQRVALARALVNKPTVVLADEPTGNLDSKNSDVVLGMLRRSNQELGQTVLMITHNPEAARFGDRIIHMRDGAIVRPEDDPQWTGH
jgi:ABC-type lipoprotein export system ATPase subunit